MSALAGFAFMLGLAGVVYISVRAGNEHADKARKKRRRK
jgi:hypothetical protein